VKAGEIVSGLDNFNNYIRGLGTWWVGQSGELYGFPVAEERLCMMRKVNELKERQAVVEKTIVRVGRRQITGKREDQVINYQFHIQWLIRQNASFYLEEKVENRQAVLRNGLLVSDCRKKKAPPASNVEPIALADRPADLFRGGGRSYDRRSAVRYAELWWNQRNPEYPLIENDCTNFVSQCLHAGAVPMWGRPVRSRGWWHERTNWSFSWAVANSLRWYLSRSGNMIGATEKERADQLVPGDVICYDFDGDGHWNHNTMVTALDLSGQPLVNAHTYNTRNRYWSYTDSPAWTPNIKYKFFHIEDDV
jgi:hypothetical protein